MVLADGCFDPIHWGHIRYLAVCASFGPVSVRVASDEAIFDKGRIPYQSHEERMKTVAAIRSVDTVIDTTDTLAQTIRQWEPDYLVKGADWRERLPSDVLLACTEVGTQIVFVDEQTRTSTERLQA